MNIKMMNALHGCVDGYMHKDGYQKGGNTTKSGFAKEFKPEIKDMMDTAKGLYDSGDLGKIAGLQGDQQDAFGRGRNAADIQDVLAGQGRGSLDRLNALAGKGMNNVGSNRLGQLVNEDRSGGGISRLERLGMQQGGRPGMDQLDSFSRKGGSDGELDRLNQLYQPRDQRGLRNAASQEARKALNMQNAKASRGGTLGGSRNRLAQNSISNDLASKFAMIDQQELGRQGQAAAQSAQLRQSDIARRGQQAGQAAQLHQADLARQGAQAGQALQFGQSQRGMNQAAAQGYSNLVQSDLNRQQGVHQGYMTGVGTAQGQAGQGAQTVGQVGGALQQHEQNLADAPYKALAQRIGLFSGLASKETTTQGGK